MNEFIVVASFVFGICIGSFLNVLIWRLPREESIGGWSHCPKCNHNLEWFNLIPLFSYLIQNRKCQYCKGRISPRYFLFELITGILFAVTVWLFDPIDLVSWLFVVKTAVVIAVCIVVFVVDFEHYLILDRVVIPAAVLMLIFNIALDLSVGSMTYSLNGVLAGVLAFIPFWLLWKLSKGLWMGFGDAKFVLFMGLALGFPGILVGLFLSFTVGAIIGLALIGIGSKQLSSRLPFGTFLSVATVITLFFGLELWNLYWGLFL